MISENSCNSWQKTKRTVAALAELLLACGAQVVAHDPYVREADWRRVLNNGTEVPLTDDLWQALDGADCAALVTRHREYQELDLFGMKNVMRTPVMIDGRNMYDPEACRLSGVTYKAVGKG